MSDEGMPEPFSVALPGYYNADDCGQRHCNSESTGYIQEDGLTKSRLLDEIDYSSQLNPFSSSDESSLYGSHPNTSNNLDVPLVSQLSPYNHLSWDFCVEKPENTAFPSLSTVQSLSHSHERETTETPSSNHETANVPELARGAGENRTNYTKDDAISTLQKQKTTLYGRGEELLHRLTRLHELGKLFGLLSDDAEIGQLVSMIKERFRILLHTGGREMQLRLGEDERG